MKTRKSGLSLATLIAMTAQASAAALCDPGAAAAPKTAAVQQELMVAGLTCSDVGAYNRFVLDYQPGLQKSDAALMTYFRDRDGSEAGYDSYKTKLANLAAGKSGADGPRFCASANRDFAAAEARGQTLDNFISTERLLIAPPKACAVQYDAVEVAVMGVPSHDLPAMPYGAPASGPVPAATAAPAPAADPDRRQAYNNLPLPRRYRHGPAEDADAYAYGPPAYGPPQAWLPRPQRWGWSGAYYDD
jgi:hypothetical protein